MTTQVNPMQTEIYSSIQQRIRSGKYTSGEKLSENVLATEFNCSRMPVREALKALEQDGLVTIQPKSGTYVRTYSNEEIKSAIEIRAYLEALAFSLLIEKNVDISSMKDCLNKMAELGEKRPLNLTEFGQCHFNFHSQMVTLAGNPFLLELYNKLHLNALQRIFFHPMTKEEIATTYEEHEKILQYIVNKDFEGEKFMKNHLWKLRDNLL